MRLTVILVCILIFTFYDFQTQGQSIKKFDASVAVKFMDSYMKFWQDRKDGVDDWIKNNALLSEKFKLSYKKFIDSSPGLNFDPIFDAQDSPDKGFKILKADTTSGYMTLNGIDWPEFTVIVKIVYEKQKWLVDGAGVINIPVDKQRGDRRK
jgi:hypothetical protein